ncbi:MAG: glycosyltransferase family 2 protein [Candidatus Hydrogenedentota bacterium]|nr:MAG: glycosyltransferase family 2 protein [Candidatus Hydrogenedentota bacterium]GIX45197.1 MAG: glycosyl transferase [Candidatus Sumerlaea sp.]
MRKKLTILIPTYNEERNIRGAIECSRWADEILVVDSFSTDATPQIAAEMGARVLQHEYVNSAAQKNWAIPQASCEWVMVLDADERIPPALRDEILAFLENPGDVAGLRIYRDNHFMGRRIRYCGWQDDSVLRVFPRDRGRYLEREVHADVVVDGPVKVLRNKLYHNTFESFDQYMRKFDRYTTWAAGDRAKTTRKVTAVHLFLRPAWRFFRQYFLRFGFLDGRAGLIICMLAAFSVFLKYAKLWERQEREQRERK